MAEFWITKCKYCGASMSNLIHKSYWWFHQGWRNAICTDYSCHGHYFKRPDDIGNWYTGKEWAAMMEEDVKVES